MLGFVFLFRYLMREDALASVDTDICAGSVNSFLKRMACL